jgi:lysophospholipase L1-like esterase
VAYGSGSGPFTVSIDGAAAVTVTPTGGGRADKYTVTGLTNNTHTVKVTTTSTTVTQVFAFNVWKSSGLQIHNMALCGMTAKQWAISGVGSRGWLSQNLGITPDVIHVALGVNDLNYSTTLGADGPTTVVNVGKILDQWPNADAVIYAEPAPATTGTVPTPPSNETWAAYVEGLRDLADSRDIPMVDMFQRSGGSNANAAANGLMGDAIHPNTTLHADWGLLMTNLISGRGA